MNVHVGTVTCVLCVAILSSACGPSNGPAEGGMDVIAPRDIVDSDDAVPPCHTSAAPSAWMSAHPHCTVGAVTWTARVFRTSALRCFAVPGHANCRRLAPRGGAIVTATPVTGARRASGTIHRIADRV